MTARANLKVVAKDSPVSEKKSAPKTSSKATSKEKPAKAPVPAQKIVQLLKRYSKDTTGTYRFQACDGDGDYLDNADAKIAHQYVSRKTIKNPDPKFIRITVEVLDKLPTDEE